MDYRVERTMKKFNCESVTVSKTANHLIYRVSISVPMAQVEKLWHLFCKNDRDGSGYLVRNITHLIAVAPMMLLLKFQRSLLIQTVDDFFARVIQYPRTGLTHQMLKLIDSTSDEAMNFGEFVEVITARCTKVWGPLLSSQILDLVGHNNIRLF